MTKQRTYPRFPRSSFPELPLAALGIAAGLAEAIFLGLPPLAFALSAGLVYAIFRLGMNLYFSFSALLVFYYVIWEQTAHTRAHDVYQAPFILAVLLIMGALVQKRRPPWTLALAGAAIGLLLGFSRIFGPVAALAVPGVLLGLLFVATRRPSITARTTGIALMVGLATGLAAILPTADTLAPEDVFLRFARPDAHLPVRPASYSLLYKDSDELLRATQKAFSKDAGQAKTDSAAMLAETFRAYPGDAVIRVYAGMAWIFGGRWGTLVAMLCFAFLAASRPWAAWCLLVLCVYFGALAGLAFRPDSLFYLRFGGPWCAFFFCAGILGLAVPRRRQEATPIETGAAEFDSSWRVAGRGAFHVFAVLLLAAAVLWTTRLVQAHRLQTDLVGTGTTSRWQSVETEALDCGDWILYRPLGHDTTILPPLDGKEGACISRYMALRIKSDPALKRFWILYENARGHGDFSHYTKLPPARDEATNVVLFPVHERAGGADAAHGWNRFAGVALPRDSAHTMLGLAQMAAHEAPTMMPLLAAQIDGRTNRLWQGVRYQKRRAARHGFFPEAWRQAGTARALMANGFHAAAEAVCRKGCGENPKNAELQYLLVETLRAQTRSAEAQTACLNAIAANPNFHAPYEQLLLLHRESGTQPSLEDWHRLIEKHPESATARYYLGKALFLSGQYEEAAHTLERAVELGARDSEAFHALGEARAFSGDFPLAFEAFRRAILQSPKLEDACLASLTAAGAHFSEQGGAEHAKAAIETAARFRPAPGPDMDSAPTKAGNARRTTEDEPDDGKTKGKQP